MPVKSFVFDDEHARNFNGSRMDTLDGLLPGLIQELGIESCLDAGCGIGYFSDYLHRLGLRTTALDGREDNIEEARRRYPEIEFSTYDIEGEKVLELARFDLVLCFGLLYHLENPFRAIRNLEALTGKIIVVESIITPRHTPVAALVNEGHGGDQSLRHVAFIPSESCIVKMLYSAGFRRVYRVVPLPDHEEFRSSFTRRRRRAMFVASRCGLASPMLSLEEERPTKGFWPMVKGQQSRMISLLRKKLR